MREKKMVENGEEAEREDERAVAIRTNEAQRVAITDQQGRWWAGLSPEILALIFVRIKPLETMIRTIPLVCRFWRDAMAGPDCWAHIDLEQWCRRVARTAAIDAAVRRLVRRSSGTLRSLSVYKISDSSFLHACLSGKFLNVLQMPMSEVTDQMVEKHAEALSKLTVLDISYCLKITSKGIKVLGKCCKALVELRRNMPPPNQMASQDNGAGNKVDESEAMAIANTMHVIEHLELAYGRFSDHGLDAILSKCGALRVLDIRGCWNCEVEGATKSKCDLIQYVTSPWDIDYTDLDYSGDEGDYVDDDEDDDDEDDSDAGIVDVDTSDNSDDDGYD